MDFADRDLAVFVGLRKAVAHRRGEGRARPTVPRRAGALSLERLRIGEPKTSGSFASDAGIGRTLTVALELGSDETGKRCNGLRLVVRPFTVTELG